MINIIRQNRGKARTRYNILLRVLKPRHQTILLKNKYISKHNMDDRFIRCIFLMEDANINVSSLQRPFINPETREISTYYNIKKSYKLLDWTCAYCKADIKSSVENFDINNFVCSKCYTYYVKDSKNVSQSVLNSMITFSNHYKKLLK